MERIELDQERQREAAAYARQRLVLRAVSLLLSLISLAVLGPLGAAAGLRDFAQRVSSAWPIQVGIFFAVLGVASGLLELPLSYYSGFLLAHRYGLSTQSMRAWLFDIGKGAALAALLGGLAVEVLYALLRLTPDTWWIWAGIFYTCLAVALTTLAPILILPLFFHIRPIEDPRLESDIHRLAEMARTRVSGVGVVNLSDKTTAANAAVIGMGRTRKIVLGDTLLQQFDAKEVEVVVAHELGHHVHGDLIRGLVSSSLLSLAGFLIANLALHAAVARLHFAGPWDLAAFPVLAAALGIWGWLTGRVELALSRHMESRADAYSLALTGEPGAFINSEIRLTNQNLARFKPPRWQEILFYSHPAPWRRVTMGELYRAREVSRS